MRKSKLSAFSAGQARFAPGKLARIALVWLLCFSCASFPQNGVNRIRFLEVGSPEVTPELEGYRIAFISDIHLGNNFPVERFEALIAAVNAQNPDCIILGGDNTLDMPLIRRFAEMSSRFSAPEGVYAVLGNHDFYNGRSENIRALRRSGIVVLDETVIITPRGLKLAGINDFRDTFPAMGRFQDILDKEGFTILASHNPDFAEKTDISSFDLVLSGHTHGGQITFFGYAPVLPSAYGQKYRSGTAWKDGTPVIVSNGAGYGGLFLRFRVGAPSDFLILTLRRTDRRSVQ